MTRSSSPLHLLHFHLSPSLLSENRMKKMPRTRVQVAPAAIVCTGYDSVCRFASPIKRDGSSRLFIAFPHCWIGVAGKWWRALKRKSEWTASGSIFGLTWPLLEEPSSFDKTDPRLNFSFQTCRWLPAFLGASGSAAVLFTAALSQQCFLNLFLLFENILTLKTFTKDKVYIKHVVPSLFNGNYNVFQYRFLEKLVLKNTIIHS